VQAWASWTDARSRIAGYTVEVIIKDDGLTRSQCRALGVEAPHEGGRRK